MFCISIHATWSTSNHHVRRELPSTASGATRAVTAVTSADYDFTRDSHIVPEFSKLLPTEDVLQSKSLLHYPMPTASNARCAGRMLQSWGVGSHT